MDMLSHGFRAAVVTEVVSFVIHFGLNGLARSTLTLARGGFGGSAVSLFQQST